MTVADEQHPRDAVVSDLVDKKVTVGVKTTNMVSCFQIFGRYITRMLQGSCAVGVQMLPAEM